MKRNVGTFVAGVALAASVVGAAVAIDSDAPTKSAGYSDPVPCVSAAGGELDCGTPVGSPVVPTATATATATVAPEPTAVPTVFIDTLPATGTGSSK
jgi:hypothetical protein